MEAGVEEFWSGFWEVVWASNMPPGFEALR